MATESTLRASVVIVTYNDEALIAACLESVLRQTLPASDYEVIVVDNASQDRTVAVIRAQFPTLRIVESEVNLGYPAGMNEGIRRARARRAVMLSSDTVVPPGWLEALLAPLEADPQVKVTHAAMVIPGDPGFERKNESVDGAVPAPEAAAFHEMSPRGLIVPHWVPSHTEPVPTLHVAGASAAVDLSILPELGGSVLDGDFFLDCDEIDLGLRVNGLGYKVLAVPAAAYYHIHPFNTQMRMNRRLAARLVRLQRNKSLAFFKNMHALEFIGALPILLLGGALKPLVYRDRFPLPRRVLAVLGLELFVWIGFLNAMFVHARQYWSKRRETLRRRRRPAYWFLRQISAPPPRQLT